MNLKKIMLLVFFSGAGLLLSGGWLVGQSCVCPENIPAVCQALLVPGSEEREEALYRALAAALQSTDAAVRSDAWQLLISGLQFDLDIRLLAEALLRFDDLDESRSQRGRRLLDEAILRQAAPAERLRIFAEAIIQGEADYGEVSRLSRQQAIALASSDELPELVPLVAANVDELADLTAGPFGQPLPKASASGPDKWGYIRAAMGTAYAIKTAIGAAKPGSWDYDVATLLKSLFVANGFPALPCWTTATFKVQHIVASGPNAVKYDFDYWPYPPNPQTGDPGRGRLLEPVELLLIDTGASCLDMCSDVTRTFPIDTQFTDEQLQLYNIVLSTFQKGQQMLSAIDARTSSLTLGYLEGRLRESMGYKAGSLKYYCPYTKKWELLMHFADSAFCPGKANYRHGHPWVHYVGWNHDVHGLNTYWSGPLRPGQVFALELGLYIPEVRGIGNSTYYQPPMGIRIEDTFLVETNGKVMCLSCQCPKDVSSILALRRQALTR